MNHSPHNPPSFWSTLLGGGFQCTPRYLAYAPCYAMARSPSCMGRARDAPALGQELPGSTAEPVYKPAPCPRQCCQDTAAMQALCTACTCNANATSTPSSTAPALKPRQSRHRGAVLALTKPQNSPVIADLFWPIVDILQIFWGEAYKARFCGTIPEVGFARCSGNSNRADGLREY